jgi:hypothetical protein
VTRLPRRNWLILSGCLVIISAAVWFSGRPPVPLAVPTVASKPQVDPLNTPERHAAAGKMIRSFGYDCQYVNSMAPYAWSDIQGYTVRCNGFRYTFYIENHGGRWSVKSD